MDLVKWRETMRVYDQYERRFAEARLARAFCIPSPEEDRRRIVADVKQVLGFDEELVPVIGEMEELGVEMRDGYDVIQLRYATWKNFYGAASLFIPHGGDRVPLVFVFPGHGAHGRLTVGYVSMAHRLAKMGMAVLVPDNIGQGDRADQGHWNVVAPFYCGLTLQGMILMESVALIRRMMAHPRVDAARMGACGNSGGGTLCLFLAALAPELAALSASGYPSEFSYILSKERPHCACNLLHGCAHGPDMWEVLSTFAPKPLCIEQGTGDDLIPHDVFLRTARKVGSVYRLMEAVESFEMFKTKTAHPWTNEDRYLIASFLGKHLGGKPTSKDSDEDEALLASTAGWHLSIPRDSLDTEALAEALTGKIMPKGTVLADIYPPLCDGKPLSADSIIPDIGRGDVMRILAQMECALDKKEI